MRPRIFPRLSTELSSSWSGRERRFWGSFFDPFFFASFFSSEWRLRGGILLFVLGCTGFSRGCHLWLCSRNLSVKNRVNVTLSERRAILLSFLLGLCSFPCGVAAAGAVCQILCGGFAPRHQSVGMHRQHTRALHRGLDGEAPQA